MLCLYFALGHAYLPIDTSLTPVTLDIVSADNLSLLTEAESTAFTADTPAIKGVTGGDFINHMSLAFPPYSLLPGNVYRFRLAAKGKNGQYGEAMIDIKTESVPSSGFLLVQPNTGMPIHTSFSLRARSWTDSVGDVPLKYRFGFFPKSTSDDVVWLSGITPKDELTMRLPFSTDAQSINLALQAFDVNGAAVIHSQTLRFETHLSPDVDLNEVYYDIYTDSILHGQWMNGLASTMSVLHALNRDGMASFTDPSGEQDFKRLVTSMTIQVLKHHIPHDKSIYLLIANLLKEATETVQYSPVEILSLLRALDDIVQMLADGQSWRGPAIAKGLAQGNARTVLFIYSNLIKQHSQMLLNATVGRIREDSITNNYHANMPALSYGLCQQLGSYESSDPISDPVLGSLRVSRIPPLNNQTVIDADGSTFAPSFVDFGQSIFKHFLQLSTAQDAYRNPNDICFTMVQSVNNLHWQGSMFEHRVKSAIVTLMPMSSNSGESITFASLNDPFKLTLPLLQDPSLSGTLQCAIWEEASLEWSTESCSTLSVSMESQRKIYS